LADGHLVRGPPPIRWGRPTYWVKKMAFEYFYILPRNSSFLQLYVHAQMVFKFIACLV